MDTSDTKGERGQSVTIGAIIIFGFLIAALGLYQVSIVPNQNADVEAAHADAIDEDFSELFAGVINTDETGESYTAVVKLGTKYPARALTLNPPPASGSIRTTELGRISGTVDGNEIESSFCGIGTDPSEGNPTTKTVVYNPGYNELDGVGVHVYENTAIYQDVDGSLAESEQQLVQGNNINLRLVTLGTLSDTSTSAKPVTFKSGVTGGDTVTPSSSWTLTLPTRLDDGTDVDIWEQILEEPRDAGTVTDVREAGPDSVEIEFASGTYQIRCTPMGIDETPQNDPDFVPGDSSSGGSQINPTGPNELELTDVAKASGGGGGGGNNVNGESVVWEATFTNNGGSKTIERVRVPYVSSPGNSFDGDVDLKHDGESVSVTVGQGFESIGGSGWEWDASGPEQTGVVDVADDTINANNAGAAVVVEFSDDTTSTYFISTSN